MIVLAISIIILILPILDTSQYNLNPGNVDSILAPSLPELPSGSSECEKKYSLWDFCLGICDRNGEFEYWKCSPWSGYLELVGKINTINWRTSIPYGIISTLYISVTNYTLYYIDYTYIISVSQILALTNVVLSLCCTLIIVSKETET